MTQLKDRVRAFNLLQLPGQPQGMHIGTSRLVSDLWDCMNDLYAACEMIRDADEDCKRDGLPTIPIAARQRIDAAIARAQAQGEQS